MDCDRESVGMALVPFQLSSSNANESSQESSGRSESLKPGLLVNLLRDGFGEVGHGTIVEVHPTGQWLGVHIPLSSVEFVLLRPTFIRSGAHNLSVEPCQRGFTNLEEVFSRTILWRRTDVMVSVEDTTTDEPPFVPQENWVGLEVHRKNPSGVVVSSGRINCSMASDYFREGTLGEAHIGVTILDVFLGDADAIMSHDRWPIAECWFPDSRSLQSTIDHFASIPVADDPDAHLGGRLKAPYRFLLRRPNLNIKESKYSQKTSDNEIRKVSSERCCAKRCCQWFPQQDTRTVRQKFYLKSFEDRREYGIAASGQMHSMDGDRKRKYMTLHGAEVCSTAWYRIHGIPKSTFFAYVEKFNEGVVNSTHGNKGCKRPRIGTVQVQGTMASIVRENADQMPHQMRGIGHGRMDTLKFLPAGNNWKQVQADANEVIMVPLPLRFTSAAFTKL
jgi:hypothetical protein